MVICDPGSLGLTFHRQIMVPLRGGGAWLWFWAKEKIILITWITFNLALLLISVHHHCTSPKYFYTRQLLGASFCLSRGTAAVINFSSFAIFLPMCRLLLTTIRNKCSETKGTWCGNLTENGERMESDGKSPTKVSAILLKFISSLQKLVIEIVDQTQSLHILFAHTIMIASMIHSLAHIINFKNSVTNYDTRHLALNIAKFPGQSPLEIILESKAGITGVLMVIVLTLMFLTSLRCLREKIYDLFWFSHHFFILFVLLLLAHPLGGLLKEQINLEEHEPGCAVMVNVETVINQTRTNNLGECKSLAVFQPMVSSSWKWMGAALVIYLTDLVLRVFQRRRQVQLLSSNLDPASNFLELQLAPTESPSKSKLVQLAQPGQYIYVKCPEISSLQWHPFSFSSLPDANKGGSFSIQVRPCGDWTGKLDSKITNKVKNKPKLYVDGPFHSPLQSIFNYHHSICIAGGIGVTPFLSALNLLSSQRFNSKKLQRLDVIWLSRDILSFINLKRIFLKLQHLSSPELVRVQLYVTRQKSNEDMYFLQKLPLRISPTKVKLSFGSRPSWPGMIQSLNSSFNHQKKTTAVFCSGPRNLRKDVKRACRQIAVQNNVQIVYKQENFGF